MLLLLSRQNYLRSAEVDSLLNDLAEESRMIHAFRRTLKSSDLLLPTPCAPQALPYMAVTLWLAAPLYAPAPFPLPLRSLPSTAPPLPAPCFHAPQPILLSPEASDSPADPARRSPMVRAAEAPTGQGRVAGFRARSDRLAGLAEWKEVRPRPHPRCRKRARGRELLSTGGARTAIWLQVFVQFRSRRRLRSPLGSSLLAKRTRVRSRCP